MKNKQLIIEAQESLQKAKDNLEALLKADEKLELTPCNYKVSNLAHFADPFFIASDIKRGEARATKELAEIASKNMLKRNRLESWVHERQGDSEGSSVIYYYNSTFLISTEQSKILGAVYMSKETAEWICERLNDRRITL